VLQRRDERDVGGQVVGREAGALERAGKIVDPDPTPAGEGPVDLAHPPLHPEAVLAVAGDLLPARPRGLPQGDAAAQFGRRLEQLPEGLELLRNALGVVETIDAEDDAAAGLVGAQARRLLDDDRLPRAPLERARIDRDREGPDAHVAVVPPDADDG